MIVPKSATIGNKQQITAITFKDENRNQAGERQEFALTINVKDLEKVVMEICDYLIQLRG